MMDIDRLLELAWRRMQHGQIDGAIENLREVLAEDPDQADAHAYLALCLLDKKRLHAALHEASLALAIEPGSEIAHLGMANIAIAQRNFKTAQEHIDQLLDIDPTDPRYYVLQADLNRLLRKTDGILPLLQRALELAPESSSVLAELSDYYHGIGDLEQAEHYAHESLRQDPESEHGLIAMGYVLLQRGEIEAAREHAVSALQQAPDNSGALALMASIKARTNPLLGLWWRYNVWMNSVGSTRSILVLLFAYLVFRVTTMGFNDLGQPEIANYVQWAWLAIVIYTFVGPTVFIKSLKKELSEVKLSREF